MLVLTRRDRQNPGFLTRARTKTDSREIVFLSRDGAGHCFGGRRGESLFGRLLDLLSHGARVRRAAAWTALQQRSGVRHRVGHRARLVFFSFKMVLLIFLAEELFIQLV